MPARSAPAPTTGTTGTGTGRLLGRSAVGKNRQVGPTHFLLTVDLNFGNLDWDFEKVGFDLGFPNIYPPPINEKEGNMSSFMKPQVIQDTFVEYEEMGGTYFIPADVECTLPDDAEIVERHENKWFSRLSAPGYLDCTDWSGPFDTEKEALDYLVELYELDLTEF